MRLTHAQSLVIAQQRIDEISRASEPMRIAHAEEVDIGWVFYYDSAHFLDAGDPSAQLVGNAPLFVDASSGQLFVLGTARTYLDYLDTYRACGDPHGIPLPEVELIGWRDGALAISAIKLIRTHTGLGLSDAKQAVDAALSGRHSMLPARDVPGARALVAELVTLHFVARLRYSTQAHSVL